MLKGFWGKEPLVELKEATVHKDKDQKNRDQDMIDDVVEELAKMELNKRRRKKGMKKVLNSFLNTC